MLQDYYNNISGLKKFLIKLGISYGLILTIAYLFLRAYYINYTWYLLPFSILLYLAELHTLILLLGMFYSIWPRKYKKYETENTNRHLQINMFITVAGEPSEIVKETIKHAIRARNYYKVKVNPINEPRVIVLNDGKAAKKDNWKEIERICEELKVLHVARNSNEGFKAGNINNGLKEFTAIDPHNTIDTFFDADFCAKKEFLVEILKPLNDSENDFVQSPQRYKNLNTWVAKAAGAHQIFFFDYICPAKAYDNALFLCGTNYAIRRQSLLDTEGVENRFVTEDYATSIKLHLKGKRGVFVSKVLAKGMAPMNLKEYFNQQKRWCKGCLDANGAYMKELLFGPLTLKQKIHYFLSTVYYFIGVRDAILVLAPIPYLFFGISLIRANTIVYLAFIYLPLIIYNFILFFLTFRDPVKSLVLDVVSFPVFATAFLSSVIKKNLPFTITIKKYEKENPFKVYKIQLFVLLILFTGLIYSVFEKNAFDPRGALINHFWATYSAAFLALGFILVVRENYNVKSIENVLANSFNFTKNYALKPATFVITCALVGIYLGYNIKTGTIAYEDYSQAVDRKVTDTINITKKAELLVPLDGVYYGYYNPELDLHPDNFDTGIVEGESPSLVMYYQDWNEDSKFNTRLMNKISEKGAIPVVTWEPWDYKNPDNPLLNYQGYPSKAILSGKYDSHIRSWAIAAKDYKRPLFLRFAHEMNGNWYAWGNYNEGSAEEYKKMWIHVYNIFEEEGATNVLWVWSPNNTDGYGETQGVLDFYPGGEYVDWVAYSGFNWGSTSKSTVWKDFKNISYAVYIELGKLGKPIMVAETSSVSIGGNKELWFINTLTKDIPEMPDIKAVVFYNADFYGGADFVLDSGMNAEKVIGEVILQNDYFLKEPIVVYR